MYRYDNPDRPTAWKEFLTARDAGEVCEIDAEMFNYWLDVLPPVFMGRKVTFPDGTARRCAFGFAEGAELVTAFWSEGDRYFCRRTGTMNPYA